MDLCKALIISIPQCSNPFLQKLMLTLCTVYVSMYEGGLKGFRPSLHETRDKRPLDRESNRSWCHRHTTTMIKFFWSQLMAPWASGAAYGQGEKFWPSLQPI